jgi:glyoxylase-like metal-dependent hydrolase (beta-lactamase superfamily II)
MSHGIHTIDTGFHRPSFDAAYLIVEGGRGAFVDCGTSLSVPNMLAVIAAANLTPEDIDWLILTHVHLDHAGGAGALMRELPNARAVVHPRGAPHMIDPARLIAGATAVYGEAEMARSYGSIVPIPAERVDLAHDGHVVDLAGRNLLCLDTPGHASHHICIFDAASRSIFTGDTFGISYRDFDGADSIHIFPTTTPVQFDPDALKASIARLVALEPENAYLTHYGRIGDIESNAKVLVEQINAMVDIALQHADAADRHARIAESLADLYAPRASAISGRPEADARELLAMDIELNAQGLGVWLDRINKRPAT